MINNIKIELPNDNYFYISNVLFNHVTKEFYMKQYVAQVYLMTANGDDIQFLCTPGTHHDKIKRIKKGRLIIEERVRFIEKLPQKTGWSFSDIPRLESITERIKET